MSKPAGSKSARLLAHISRHPGGLTFTQIQRFVWEMNHPGRPFTRSQRGYWCTNLLGGFYYHDGILRTFCTKGEDGRWRRNEKAGAERPWAHV